MTCCNFEKNGHHGSSNFKFAPIRTVHVRIHHLKHTSDSKILKASFRNSNDSFSLRFYGEKCIFNYLFRWSRTVQQTGLQFNGIFLDLHHYCFCAMANWYQFIQCNFTEREPLRYTEGDPIKNIFFWSDTDFWLDIGTIKMWTSRYWLLDALHWW